MAPTDPRFLDATPEQIITEYWAHEALARKAAGRPDEEEFEDEDFDLDKALSMERMPDDWETLIEDAGDVSRN